MNTYVTPIVEPFPNLNGFVQSRGQNEVNAVDAQRIHLTEKFKHLADMGELAFEHLYLAFEFCLPANVVLDIQAISAGIRVTAEMDGLLVNGIMSASFRTWKQFLMEATSKDFSSWLNKTAQGMYTNTFINIPYFKDLKYSPQSQALVKA